MKEILSDNLIKLARTCPYPLYVVGGRVRDFLAGLETADTDTDICAPANAEDFVRRAKNVGFNVDAAYKNTGFALIFFIIAFFQNYCNSYLFVI